MDQMYVLNEKELEQISGGIIYKLAADRYLVCDETNRGNYRTFTNINDAVEYAKINGISCAIQDMSHHPLVT